MITCPQCKKELPDGTKFCSACGSPLSVAPAVETEVAQETETTPVVEATQEPEPTPVVETSANSVNDILAKSKKIPVKLIGIVAGIVLVVILGITLISNLFSGGSDNPEYAVYLKEDQLYLNLLGGKESIEITDDLADDYDTDSILNKMDKIYSLTYLTSDKKTIIYPDKYSSSGFTLYYRNAKKADSDAEKIDKGVVSYVVSENEKTLVYLTSDGKLYSYDFKEKEKIDTDVSSYYVSSDAKKIIYVDYDSNIYVYEKGDSEKIAKDASIAGFSEDMDTIFFMKDDKLYIKNGSKDEEKIDSDVYGVITTYSDGTAYFIKKDNKTISLMDYVYDDMAETDANLVEPEYPDSSLFEYPPYPYSFSWSSIELYAGCASYEEAYDLYQQLYERVDAEWDAAYDAYLEAYEIYYDKSDRDYLRESLKDATMDINSYTLYFFDGKDVVEIASDFVYSGYDYSTKENSPVLVYKTETAEGLEKLNLSEIDSTWDVEDYIYYADTETSLNVAVKGKSSVVELDNLNTLSLSADGKTLYVIADVNDDYEGTLYKASISSSVGKMQAYDEEVTAGYLSLYANGNVVYFKDDSEALYINKTKIDEDVYAATLVPCNDGDTLYYLKDLDSSDYTGTLAISKSGKAGTEIEDDVLFLFSATSTGGVLYFTDYDMDDYEGTLLYSENGKAGTEIDDEAQMIMDPIPYLYYYN